MFSYAKGGSLVDQYGLLGFPNTDVLNNWKNIDIRSNNGGSITIIGYRTPRATDTIGRDKEFKCGTSENYLWVVGGYKGKWTLDTELSCDLVGEVNSSVTDYDIRVIQGND